MNVITLTLAVLFGGLQVGEDLTAHEILNEQKCITAERITKSVQTWKTLSTELVQGKKKPYIVVELHNALNKAHPTSADAKFVFSIDPSMPSNPEKYSLMIATFFNPKATVVFRRIFTINKTKVKNRIKDFPMQTPCFARDVNPIIQMEPVTIEKNTNNGK